VVGGSSPNPSFALTVKELSLHPDAILEAAEARLWYLDRSNDAAVDIWYRIREEEIRVLAFAHARRRPGYWKSRA
jgi:hypothetical protein